MSKYEDKPGSGTLFENDRALSDSHPQFRGFFIIPEGFKAGDRIQLSAWMKETREGKELVSLAFDKREQEYQDGKRNRAPAPAKAAAPSDRASGQRGGERASAQREAQGYGQIRDEPADRYASPDLDDEIPF